MKLTIIGAGYVGLVSAACFAHLGHEVTAVDQNAERVADLSRGRIPIYEPGLEEMVRANAARGRLSFTTDLRGAVGRADMVFIAVGTPPAPRGGADLRAVFAVAQEVAAALRRFTVVVVKSTVPVGTGDRIEARIRKLRPGADFAVASNPEFLREACAIRDFLEPDRVVVGTGDARARRMLADLYGFCEGRAPVLMMDRRTAELTKYAANAFLATKITFINQMADLCEKVGADVEQVALGMGTDSRIGGAFLRAGPGYGGSCFPKDTAALLETARDADIPLDLVHSVITANRRRIAGAVEKVRAACRGHLNGRRIAVLGLTFKADTDDVRDSPAVPIVALLQRYGARVCVYDPKGMEQARAHLSDVSYAADPYDCVRAASAAVIVTDWGEFRDLDLSRVARLMKRPAMVDLRNLFEPAAMAAAGFDYRSVGRPAARPQRRSPLAGIARQMRDAAEGWAAPARTGRATDIACPPVLQEASNA